MHGYEKRYWKKLNTLYLDCMRKVIGAHETASGYAVLVRMGIFPLQYELVFRALMWYLKIVNGESDATLNTQLEKFHAEDNGDFALTCFYRHCHRYIKQISIVAGVDILELPKCKRKETIRDAMFKELDILADA